MTRTTTYLLGILLTILVGIFLYLKRCSSCSVPVITEAPAKEAVVPAEPEATSYPFAFRDGEYAYNVNDNYNFNVSSAAILMPLSPKVSDGITGLKAFLADHPGKAIDVTGYYRASENNDTAFPNLGLARANAVKNHLVAQGISAAQINTMGQLRDEMVPKDQVYLGPVAYALTNQAIDMEDTLKVLFDAIVADPLVLYFETGQASIDLNADQRQKVADISRYLDKVPKARAKVTGHTDNSGRRTTNIRLGRERADFAKGYLIENGIAETKIVTDSKGPDLPVADNSTEEGKAKNRRTVVTLMN